MGNGKKLGLGIIAIFSLMLSVPAHAACWTVDEVAAAKVRDMETMLMVSALRCRMSEQDFLPAYNAFVRSGRAGLIVANERLRGHYVASLGAVRALGGYDRYVTSIANRYGSGAEGLSCRDLSSITDAAIAQGSSFDALHALAVRADVQPVLDGAVCTTEIAALQ